MAKRRTTRPWKEDLKDLFAMHRGERRAFAVLLGLCIIAAAWVTWEQWIRPPMLADREAKAIEVLWRGMQDGTQEADARKAYAEEAIRLFPFNPNHLPAEQWQELGLSERQAASIHKFEARGGSFRTKADLARMRVVDPGLFARWEPYIQLPEGLSRATHQAYPPERHWGRDTAGRTSPGFHREGERRTATAGPLELNTADSAALVALRGIGPSFAHGILGYRQRLGGFVSLDQLAEVFILRDKPDAVERLKALLTLDPAAVHRIPINTCTVEDLGPHPYAGWKLARVLVAYREQHGPFKQPADIARCALVTDSIRLRLTPYLTVE